MLLLCGKVWVLGFFDLLLEAELVPNHTVKPEGETGADDIIIYLLFICYSFLEQGFSNFSSPWNWFVSFN